MSNLFQSNTHTLLEAHCASTSCLLPGAQQGSPAEYWHFTSRLRSALRQLLVPDYEWEGSDDGLSPSRQAADVQTVDGYRRQWVNYRRQHTGSEFRTCSPVGGIRGSICLALSAPVINTNCIRSGAEPDQCAPSAPCAQMDWFGNIGNRAV